MSLCHEYAARKKFAFLVLHGNNLPNNPHQLPIPRRAGVHSQVPRDLDTKTEFRQHPLLRLETPSSIFSGHGTVPAQLVPQLQPAWLVE
ncbi:hypothetical protein D3C81_1815370 [compost metagenome]